jgi:hypothetical protein
MRDEDQSELFVDTFTQTISSLIPHPSSLS